MISYNYSLKAHWRSLISYQMLGTMLNTLSISFSPQNKQKTTTLQKVYSHSHLTDKEREAWESSNLPRFTQLALQINVGLRYRTMPQILRRRRLVLAGGSRHEKISGDLTPEISPHHYCFPQLEDNLNSVLLCK